MNSNPIKLIGSAINIRTRCILNHSPFPKLGLMNAGKNKAIGTRKPHAMYMRAPTRMGTIGEKTDDMKLQQQGGSSI
jgi:hypothetical protein